MKIIEAMKTVKGNQAKINDLVERIKKVSAHTSIETPEYGADTGNKVKEWLQAIHDIGQENIRLNVAIAKTNLQTNVSISIGDKTVTKTIAEWIWRRREYASVDFKAWSALTDRNIREGVTKLPSGDTMEIKIVRNFDPVVRDNKIAEYRNEPFQIDSTLEVVNATTDLVE